MGGSSEKMIKSCSVRTVKCQVEDDFNFDDNGWGGGAEDFHIAEFWKDIGLICLWPSVIILACLFVGALSYIVAGLYLKSDPASEEKSAETAPKTLQSAEKSDYVDTNNNNDNLEFDRDGIYDFEHTITFGPIRRLSATSPHKSIRRSTSPHKSIRKSSSPHKSLIVPK